MRPSTAALVAAVIVYVYKAPGDCVPEALVDFWIVTLLMSANAVCAGTANDETRASPMETTASRPRVTE